MALFHCTVSFLSRVHKDSSWNLPSGSTCTMFQSMMWVGTWIYFLIRKHEKHYELLSFQKVLVDMPWVQFKLKYRRGHKTWAPTLNNFLNFERSSLLWISDIHGPQFEIPDVSFLNLCSFSIGLGPPLNCVVPFLPFSPFLGAFPDPS